MTSLFPDEPLGKAIPEIKSFCIEYEHTEARIPKDERKGMMTEQNGNKELACKWQRCKKGGFSIQQAILSPMVSKRETKSEGLLPCFGHEYLDKRNQPPCPNRLRYSITIEYHEDTPGE